MVLNEYIGISLFGKVFSSLNTLVLLKLAILCPNNSTPTYIPNTNKGKYPPRHGQEQQPQT